jgi:hypothetical protein
MDINYDNIQDNTLELTKEINHGHLRILLRELVNSFNNTRIRYWIDHGTLLGCLRNSKFIPWDDDADLSCFYSDRFKIKTMLQTICSKGRMRHFKKIGAHYCYYYSHDENTHVDIFFYRPIENAPKILELVHHISWHIWEDDVSKLTTRRLEDIIVKIPQQAGTMMERHYGIGWLYNVHKYQSGKEKEYYSLSHTDEYEQILDWKLLWEADRPDKISAYFQKYPPFDSCSTSDESLPVQTKNVPPPTKEQRVRKLRERERKKQLKRLKKHN